MNVSVSFMSSSFCHVFQSEGNYAFVNTTDSMGRRQKENSRRFKSAYERKSSTFFKTTLPQKNGPRIKTPYRNLMNLVSIYSEKNILSNTAKINCIQSRMLLKLRIKIVAFFLCHSVYLLLYNGQHAEPVATLLRFIRDKHDKCNA